MRVAGRISVIWLIAMIRSFSSEGTHHYDAMTHSLWWDRFGRFLNVGPLRSSLGTKLLQMASAFYFTAVFCGDKLKPIVVRGDVCNSSASRRLFSLRCSLQPSSPRPATQRLR